MARIRTIKPDFCSSADVGALSRDARLFFLQLLTEVDDEGRLLWIPRRLCGVLYPHDADVTSEMVSAWARECVARRMLAIYTADGHDLVQVVKWSSHQKISHPSPSRLPAYSGELPSILPNGSGNAPEALRPDLGIDLGIDLGNKAPSPPSAATDLKDVLFERWKALPNSGGAPFFLCLLSNHKPERDVLKAVERTLAHRPVAPKPFVLGLLRKQNGDAAQMAALHRSAI